MVRAEKLQISRDPNNLNWKSDTTAFGYKMLMKMGWSEGKGLGVNEQGPVANVKVKKNIESRGIGADVDTSRNWLANSVAFDALLKNLNGAYADVVNEVESKSTSNTSSNNNSTSKEKKRKNESFVKEEEIAEPEETEAAVSTVDEISPNSTSTATASKKKSKKSHRRQQQQLPHADTAAVSVDENTDVVDTEIEPQRKSDDGSDENTETIVSSSSVVTVRTRKHSKAIRYPKIVRAKSVRNYSTQDLNAILGGVSDF